MAAEDDKAAETTKPATYQPPTIEPVAAAADEQEERSSPLPHAQAVAQEQEERVQLLADDDDDDDDNNVNTLLFKGSLQPPAYRDAWCAVLFVLQLGAVITTAAVYGPAVFSYDTKNPYHNDTASHDDDDDDDDNSASDDYNDSNHDDSNTTTVAILYLLLLLTGFFVAATGCTFVCLRTLLQYPTRMIQVAFFTAPVVFLGVALLGTMAAACTSSSSDDVTAMAYLWILAAVLFALTLCWYKCYARFIPFAASTLQTALTALRGHQATGVYALQLTLWIVLYLYTAVWCLAVGGLYVQSAAQACRDNHADDNNNDDACDDVPMNLPAVFGLLLSLYWTQQVIQNLVHTTTSVRSRNGVSGQVSF